MKLYKFNPCDMDRYPALAFIGDAFAFVHFMYTSLFNGLQYVINSIFFFIAFVLAAPFRLLSHGTECSCCLGMRYTIATVVVIALTLWLTLG